VAVGEPAERAGRDRHGQSGEESHHAVPRDHEREHRRHQTDRDPERNHLGPEQPDSLEDLPDATVVTLQDYLAGNATDVAADRRDDISNVILGFLAGIDREQNVQRVSLPEGEGQVAGLLYRIQGAWPPLVLLRLQYSPSQWDPLLDRLSQHYSTITLSGANVGSVFSLETRARGGYLEVVRKVVEESRLQPGEKVLDVGCGPGSLDRWLAYHTRACLQITTIGGLPLLSTLPDSWLLASHTWSPGVETASAG
jgi:hypothetical protein